MTAAGQKRGIFGQVRRNRGNAASNPFSDRAFAERLRRKGGLCQPGRSVLWALRWKPLGAIPGRGLRFRRRWSRCWSRCRSLRSRFR